MVVHQAAGPLAEQITPLIQARVSSEAVTKEGAAGGREGREVYENGGGEEGEGEREGEGESARVEVRPVTETLPTTTGDA